jgi:glycosyltransferase involved in cell wall biosynthesis
VLCGEPESRSYAAHLAALAGAGVEFFGRAPLAALLEFLAQATALVLPSHQENAPMVVAEAMAAGVPVVATRVGALPEMVEDGVSGWLVDPSEDALHAALCAILDDPGAAAEMGRRGRQLAWQRYHPQCVAQATLDVYEQLLR